MSFSSLFPSTIIIAGIAWVILIRVFVGYQPHSGQDNYQGPGITTDSTTTTTTTGSRVYGGDYEAQRHWMELTLHLPMREWYYYDTPYWGLDYPPLTAYHSYLCGYIGHHLFHFVDAMALDTSRGYEHPLHKAYMRSTVIVSDVLVYATVIGMFVVSAATAAANTRNAATTSNTAAHSSIVLPYYYHFIYCMIQPAILLIDHGHFQYNTVALGLSLWSIYYITKKTEDTNLHTSPTMTNCIIGSIFFCCALSFKQMTLYYAPAIFFYLLGRCFAAPPTIAASDGHSSSDNANFTGEHAKSSNVQNIRSYLFMILSRVAVLGITVISTLTLLWWPFILDGPPNTTYIERAKYMFERIIPIRRGLFEGKVSNIWCALSVSPFRIRQRIPTSYQPIAALLLTLVLLIPSSIHLFNVGRRSHQNKLNQSNSGCNYYCYDRQQLLWGTTNTALAFFLASFQVHEKSLLLALAPCSLLLLAYDNTNNTDYPDTATITTTTDSKFVHWFSIVTVWTLWPLLQIDRLTVGYVCTIVLFVSVIGLYQELLVDGTHPDHRPMRSRGFFDLYSMYHFDWLPRISFVLMMLLHLAECIVVVPKHLPDLFPVLWSIIGCGFCCLAYIITCWHMLYRHQTTGTRLSASHSSTKLKAQ